MMTSWKMLGWNKAAGILTLFGLTGLLLSPFILTPAVSAPTPEGRIVAIAIAAGPQLRLLGSVPSSEAPENTANSTKQAMVCSRVFRLAFADIGFSCQDGAQGGADVAAITKAAMKTTISAPDKDPRAPDFAVAGN